METYLTNEPERETWMSNAYCASTDPDIFFDSVGHNERATRAAARGICQPCPVKMQCLAYAMAFEKGHKFRYGIYGGCTPTERKTLQSKIDRL